MPPRRKHTVNLLVEPGFKLPEWFANATPRQVSDFLSKAEETKDEPQPSPQDLHTLVEEVKANTEATRTTLQARIDELTQRSEEALESVARITAERDALLARGEETTDHQAPVQAHAESLTTHLTEMFELLANHDSILRQLDESIAAIRVKSMSWYRATKKSDLFSKLNLSLPWEHAYEHAIGRVWNNMTSAKAKELDKALGRKAAELAIAEEKCDGPDPQKRQRVDA